MNTVQTEQSMIRYYTNHEGIGVWGALTLGFGVIIGSASIAAHSLTVTSDLLLGTAAVWYVGYYLLSKSSYFISPTNAGFKDLFRKKEVQFDEVRSVTKFVGSESTSLMFRCETRNVSMPLDPFDESWSSAVETELRKRGIPLSTRTFGFKLKT